MPTFRYRTYGLDVESEIECPDLPPSMGRPQVRVCYGTVPSQITNPLLESPSFQSSPDEFLFRLNHVGRILVTHGDKVCVDPAEGVDPDLLRAHVFGSLFGVVLHQRRILPLHASAIATPRGAVLFCGQRGYGKSTLAGEFYKRGYPIIADDVCAVSTLPDRSLLHSARPLLLIRTDSAVKLGLCLDDLHDAPHRPGKHLLPVGDVPNLDLAANSDAITIQAICVLEPSDNAPIDASPLSGFTKISTLTQNIFRLELGKGLHAELNYFEQICSLAKNTKALLVTRPTGEFLLSELADHIEQTVFAD